MNTYFRDTLGDPGRDRELGHLEVVIRPNLPVTEFDLDDPRWKEVREVVK